MEEQKKINKNRLILGLIALSAIVITIIFYSSNVDVLYKEIFVYVFIWVDTSAVVFFICSFTIKYKTYTYENNDIIVFAGWTKHYIKVNGTIYDEHTTLLSFTPINLSCNLNETTRIDVTISLSNKIALKINNKLFLPNK